MRNNLQNDVKVEKPTGKVSKFNLSGSNANTHSIGEVTVAFSRLLQPHSKSMVGVENLLYLAPMVAPVYAKQHYKTWHQFVPIEDVWPNYSAFMTQQSISRGGVTFTPTKMPYINKDRLTLFTLLGCHMSLWLCDVTNKDISTDAKLESVIRNGVFWDIDESHLAAPTGYWWKMANEILNPYYTVQTSSRPAMFSFKNWAGLSVDASGTTHDTYVGNTELKFSNNSTVWGSFFRHSSYEEVEEKTGLINKQVTLDGADYVLYHLHEHTKFDSSDSDKTFICALAIRCSSFGNHLAKILRGLGYGLDFDDRKEVSILPLLAAYKSYWDVFGLEMWQNFESTYCGQLISLIQNKDWTTSILYDSASTYQMFLQFMRLELGSMWLTEQNDFISAHLPQPAISANNSTPLLNVVDVMGTTSRPASALNFGATNDSQRTGQEPSDSYPDGHLHTTTTVHGYLDEEILKRLYKRVNTNTALGKKIADLMRSQGLGTYMERTKVHYIGDTNVDIDVSSVVSQADTFDASTQNGKVLASRAGKGVGYGNTKKKLFYENDSLGWWICLDCVTCDSGYSQGEDLTVEAITQDKMYQPDYDALGLELHSKAVINGSRAVSLRGVGLYGKDASESVFGFAPRFSLFKVGRNVLNGGFAQRSTEKTFVPYVMDKLVYPDNLSSHRLPDTYTETGITIASDAHIYRQFIELPVSDIPLAGTAWRYLNRYSWLSNLNRSFANVDANVPWILQGRTPYYSWGSLFELLPRIDDNYLSLSEIWFKSWSHMLPIEETYGTVDPDQKELEYITRV